MTKLRTILLAGLILFLTGCCQTVILTPKMPEKVRGWGEKKESKQWTSLGEFLLHKGESVDNGRVGVQFLNIIRKTECSGPIEGNMTPTAADFRFYSVSDGQYLRQI